ncbi:hypothetical protein SLA2020_223800 [Shorea laevis]
MPTIAGRNSSPFREIVTEGPISTPTKLKSLRRCRNSSPNSPADGSKEGSGSKRLVRLCKSPVKRSHNSFDLKQNWNPSDPELMSAVKEALHVSTAPPTVVCRETEQKRILEFCKGCLEQEKAGSLYICGCPGTGKSLSMEKVKQYVVDWARDEGLRPPGLLVINCTSLTNTSEIFGKQISNQQKKKTSPLQYLQEIYSRKQLSSGSKMMVIIADELDYLITRDRAVLHHLFMLTIFPFARFILIGIAKAIDLADRFLPRLQSLNCKPLVVTFRAYVKDQILRILQERLMALPYVVFQPQALELCARKVAAASGDMRKALSVCRSAVEMLEAELRELSSSPNSSTEATDQQTPPGLEVLKREQNNSVRIDHMAAALSKTFRSPAVDTIQSLPQHQQIILCSAAKFFRGKREDTTIEEVHFFLLFDK